MSHIWLPWADGPLARLLTGKLRMSQLSACSLFSNALGWILPMNHQLLQLVKETFIGIDFADNCVLQDFIIPLQHVKKAIELNHVATEIYPLWLVPARLYFPSIPKALQPEAGDVMFVDVGVYGFSHLPNFSGREKTLRSFEKFTLTHKGFQALYAETLLNYEEFCQMFPREIYEKVIRMMICIHLNDNPIRTNSQYQCSNFSLGWIKIFNLIFSTLYRLYSVRQKRGNGS